MTPTVRSEKIEGVSVYGLPQYEYTLEGAEGRLQFCSVATEASFQQTAAVETQISAVAAAMNARRRKLDDYGKALSAMAGLIPNIKQGKNPKSTDEVWVEWGKGGREYYDSFLKLRAIYGLGKDDFDFRVEEKDSVTYFVMFRSDLQKGQAKLEDALDRDNNSMQEEMTTLDGYVAKRDKSFSVAEKVVKKYHSAADNTIKAMA